MPSAVMRQSVTKVTEARMRRSGGGDTCVSCAIGRPPVPEQKARGSPLIPCARQNRPARRRFNDVAGLNLFDAVGDIGGGRDLVSRRTVAGGVVTKGKCRALAGIVVK